MSLVSWIMPVYNAEATLSRAIQSVCTQTERDWEMLIVDDGSEDNSLGIAQAYAKKDERIRVLARAHEGLVGSLNAGLDEARGEWIARMDADDVCMEDRLKKQLEFAQLHEEVDVIATQVIYGGDPDQGRGLQLYIEWMNALVDHEDMARERFVEQPLAHPSVLVRRSCYERYGAYREGLFCEDYDLWLRWFEAGVCFGKVPEPLLIWNDSPDRFTRTDPSCDKENVFALKARYMARWLNAKSISEVYIWGAGRLARKRAAMLEPYGIQINAWVDVDPSKQSRKYEDARVIEPDELPRAGETCVLSYVASRGARALIREYLEKRSYVQGQDFWMLA